MHINKYFNVKSVETAWEISYIHHKLEINYLILFYQNVYKIYINIKANYDMDLNII